MSHVETSTYCGVAGNIQLRGNALHGVRIVSVYFPIYLRLIASSYHLSTLKNMKVADSSV